MFKLFVKQKFYILGLLSRVNNVQGYSLHFDTHLQHLLRLLEKNFKYKSLGFFHVVSFDISGNKISTLKKFIEVIFFNETPCK